MTSHGLAGPFAAGGMEYFNTYGEQHAADLSVTVAALVKVFECIKFSQAQCRQRCSTACNIGKPCPACTSCRHACACVDVRTILAAAAPQAAMVSLLLPTLLWVPGGNNAAVAAGRAVLQEIQQQQLQQRAGDTGR